MASTWILSIYSYLVYLQTSTTKCAVITSAHCSFAAGVTKALSSYCLCTAKNACSVWHTWVTFCCCILALAQSGAMEMVIVTNTIFMGVVTYNLSSVHISFASLLIVTLKIYWENTISTPGCWWRCVLAFKKGTFTAYSRLNTTVYWRLIVKCCCSTNIFTMKLHQIIKNLLCT